ncbi:MAG TPA: glycine--tRNA ligase subunit beta, partial [Allosphingosinicella sp.]
GLIGGHLARAQGEDPAVADAVRDHYKPVGQGDEVPTAPVTVAVSLADKLDTIAAFVSVGLLPSGSRDPFAIRRSLLGVIALLNESNLRARFNHLTEYWVGVTYQVMTGEFKRTKAQNDAISVRNQELDALFKTLINGRFENVRREVTARIKDMIHDAEPAGPTEWMSHLNNGREDNWSSLKGLISSLALDRLKVQQREAGVRHDLIDAVFALGGEDDLVRLLARVKALQAFVETPEGADLLAGYKRAANILKKEGFTVIPAKAGTSGQEVSAGLPEAPASAGVTEHAPDEPHPYPPELEEIALIAALDSAEPRARAGVEAEDFEGAMAALASLRAPVDSFFDKVTVNDPDPARREARLALLARMRDAVHQVADFSRIEG